MAQTVVNIASQTLHNSPASVLAFPGAVIPGSTLVVVGFGFNGGAGIKGVPPTVVDTINGAYVVPSYFGLPSDNEVEVWIAVFPNTVAGTPTVTVTPSSGAADITIVICEVKDSTPASVDISGVHNSGNSNTPNIASGVLSQNNEVIFAAVTGIWATGTITKDPTYTELVNQPDNDTNQAGEAQYKVVNVAISDQADWVLQNGEQWVNVLLTIKGSGIIPGSGFVEQGAF